MVINDKTKIPMFNEGFMFVCTETKDYQIIIAGQVNSKTQRVEDTNLESHSYPLPGTPCSIVLFSQ